jgi:predicted CoA-binding protein
VTVEEMRALLQATDTIVVVGCSADPAKEAHRVPRQMQAAGFRIIPVNPRGGEMLGEPVYPTLAEVPGPIQLVNVFRPSADAAAVAADAAAAGAKSIWLQLGIASTEARAIAERAGMGYIEDECIAVVRAETGVTHRPAPTT